MLWAERSRERTQPVFAPRHKQESIPTSSQLSRKDFAQTAGGTGHDGEFLGDFHFLILRLSQPRKPAEKSHSTMNGHEWTNQKTRDGLSQKVTIPTKNSQPRMGPDEHGFGTAK